MDKERNVIRSGFKKAFALLGALAVAACSITQPANAPQQQTRGPALWKVADADTTIYLFGTIHLLPEGQKWRTPLFERAIAASDELVVEVLAGDDPAKSTQTMIKLGVSPGLPPILDRIPTDKREVFAKIIAESGVPMAMLDRLETWVAAMMLTGAAFKQLGLDPELGVEKSLEGVWQDSARPMSGLETVEQQLSYLDTLSESAQRSFLLGALEDPIEARKQFDAMLQSWSTGDVKGIARTFDTELKQSPELRQALIDRRNANWAEWIDKRLDQPGTVMIAVGAGHLAGSGSVQEILKARGIKASRIQ
jgi:hypothetical protein